MRIFKIALALLCLSCHVKAQITLGPGDVPAIGDVFVQYIDTTTGLNLDLGAAGPNQTWDWSGLLKQDSLTQAVLAPENAFGHESFPEATLALATEATLATQFAQITNEAVIGLGLNAPGFFSPEPISVAYDPTQVIAQIPTNYGDQYDDSFGFSVGLPSFIDEVDSLRIISTSVATNDVDAWGTLTLPTGEFEVLKRTTIIETITAVEGLLVFFWIPLQADTVITKSYNFLAKETNGNLVTVDVDPTIDVIQSINWVNISNQTFEAPVALFEYEAAGNPEDRVFDFSDLSTGDPDNWLWNFGDGNSAAMPNPTHQFEENGTYNVCLTVGNLGGVNTSCQMVTINVLEAPVAAFSSTNTAIGFYSFTDESLNSPDEWLWDFGDGNTSSQQNPSHQFAEDGEYTVCLTASNAVGANTICETYNVSIAQAPVASFEYQEVALGPPTVDIEFTDLSSNEPLSWIWDFDDGATSTEQSPTHTFSEGNHNVCLTVANAIGSDETCETISVIFGSTSAPWESHWKLYPNPAEKSVWLELDDELIGGSVDIVAADGREVLTLVYKDGVELDISNWPSGLYFVYVEKKGKQVGVSKFFKQ